jgi:hypothetical protein
MTVSQFAHGTQTATIGTEHFLSSVNTPGTFDLDVDLHNLASGDIVELRVYKIVLTGGTARQALLGTFPYPVADLVTISDPVMNALSDAQSLRYSLKQTAGTGRAFDWAVLQA